MSTFWKSANVSFGILWGGFPHQLQRLSLFTSTLQVAGNVYNVWQSYKEVQVILLKTGKEYMVLSRTGVDYDVC